MRDLYLEHDAERVWRNRGRRGLSESALVNGKQWEEMTKQCSKKNKEEMTVAKEAAHRIWLEGVWGTA